MAKQPAWRLKLYFLFKPVFRIALGRLWQISRDGTRGKWKRLSHTFIWEGWNMPLSDRISCTTCAFFFIKLFLYHLCMTVAYRRTLTCHNTKIYFILVYMKYCLLGWYANKMNHHVSVSKCFLGKDLLEEPDRKSMKKQCKSVTFSLNLWYCQKNEIWSNILYLRRFCLLIIIPCYIPKVVNNISLKTSANCRIKPPITLNYGDPARPQPRNDAIFLRSTWSGTLPWDH